MPSTLQHPRPPIHVAAIASPQTTHPSQVKQPVPNQNDGPTQKPLPAIQMLSTLSTHHTLVLQPQNSRPPPSPHTDLSLHSRQQTQSTTTVTDQPPNHDPTLDSLHKPAILPEHEPHSEHLAAQPPALVPCPPDEPPHAKQHEEQSDQLDPQTEPAQIKRPYLPFFQNPKQQSDGNRGDPHGHGHQGRGGVAAGHVRGRFGPPSVGPRARPAGARLGRGRGGPRAAAAPRIIECYPRAAARRSSAATVV
jgi:hypothetical protein